MTDAKQDLIRAHDALKRIEVQSPDGPQECEIWNRVQEALGHIAAAMRRADQCPPAISRPNVPAVPPRWPWVNHPEGAVNLAQATRILPRYWHRKGEVTDIVEAYHAHLADGAVVRWQYIDPGFEQITMFLETEAGWTIAVRETSDVE